eukprot:TRINITY_DN1913_c0_g2_i1.p1 TRINITY_DN1913_c0_g2~~TRINITY_DN1913_c0_g2_i1.p1  ORF type:complete len:920 (+),score=215.47 TRINITY_DN1913_c0_g2_i1:40-2760(+)
MEGNTPPSSTPSEPLISLQPITASSTSNLNLGSLLRLFKSGFFDAWLNISYLFKHPITGVHDYLCNELYNLPDDDVEFFLLQLCHLLIYKKLETRSLERFLLDKSAKSLHFALKTSWIFQSALEDNQPIVRKKVLRFCEDCEVALINGQRPLTSLPSSLSVSSVLPSTTSFFLSSSSSVSAVSSEQIAIALEEKKMRYKLEFAKEQIIAKDPKAVYPSSSIELTNNKQEENNKDKTENGDKEKKGRRRKKSSKSRHHPHLSNNHSHSYPPHIQYASHSIVQNKQNHPHNSSSRTHTSHLTVEESTQSDDIFDNRIRTAEDVSSKPPKSVGDESIEEIDEFLSEEDDIAETEGKKREEKTQSASSQPIGNILAKKDRCHYFYVLQGFVTELGHISEKLQKVLPVSSRLEALKKLITEMNENLPVGMYLPIFPSSSPHHCIVRIPPEESVVLNSRDRVPYMLVIEAITNPNKCADIDIHHITSAYDNIMQTASLSFPSSLSSSSSSTSLPSSNKEVETDIKNLMIKIGNTPKNEISGLYKNSNSLSHSDILPNHPHHHQNHNGNNSNNFNGNAKTNTLINGGDRKLSLKGEQLPTPDFVVVREDSKTSLTYRTDDAVGKMKERWEDKVQRLRASSPFGHLPGWAAYSVIVKYGDECRQEHLALQLVKQIQKIFQDAKLPLPLRSYNILITSARSGIIETIPDVMSIHQLKKTIPGFTSLADYFKKTFQKEKNGEDNYNRIKRNFVESLAAYSILCYLLQVRDRHNGNILLDAEGHVIHIDFGFFLSNGPGGIQFESAPFKLTKEYVDVMDGLESATFTYFRALMIKGFQEIRKYSERIVLLVEMMAIGYRLPCLVSESVVADLNYRFRLDLTEDQLVNYVDDLIWKSYDNWWTKKYDQYQYLTNYILP